jgi:C1A family cysteine protease
MIRTLTVALLSLLSASAFNHLLHDRDHYEEKFVDYLKQYKIETKDGEDFVHKLQNFAWNLDFIEKHNASPEAKNYRVGVNQFTHLSSDEFAAYFGGKKKPLPPKGSKERPHAPNVHRAPLNSSSYPDSWDWTPTAVTPVQNQGQCGSCWSFSTAGALEGAQYISSGILPSFSEQNLVSCASVDFGCNGGYVDATFQWTQQNGGLCNLADYPYTSGNGVTGVCKQSSCTLNTQAIPTSYTDVTKNNDDALHSAIYQQPTSVLIQANQPGFQMYSSGVFTGNCGDDLDHAVLAVGYGTDASSGLPYYKIKNSWGVTWGESGYILLAVGDYNNGAGQCGVLSGPPSYPTM